MRNGEENVTCCICSDPICLNFGVIIQDGLNNLISFKDSFIDTSPCRPYQLAGLHVFGT